MTEHGRDRTNNGGITIRRADIGAEAGRINLFYVGRGSMTSVNNDLAVYIAEDAGVIIGAVRLCREEGRTLLRTMHVDAAYRGRGIGRRLLEAFQEAVRDVECYCIPFQHLVRFYGMIGFATIPPEQAPPHIQERLRQYRARGMNGIVMRREKDMPQDGGSTNVDRNSGSFSED